METNYDQETLESKRQLAKLLYTRNCSPEQEIIKLLGINMQQFARWAQEDGWEAYSKSFLRTKDEQLRLFYDQLSNLNDAIMDGAGYPTEKEAMTQKRLASSIEHLETNTTIGDTIAVAKEFLDWIFEVDKANGKLIGNHLDTFIKRKVNRK